MENILNCSIYGILGALALFFFLQVVIGRLLPGVPPPAGESLRTIQRNTASGEDVGDSDIYNLDLELMDAELEHPGSTLRLYYNQPIALFGRILGSLLVSFSITGWIFGSSQFTCYAIFALLLGISFLLYPYLTWSSSRPRFKE